MAASSSSAVSTSSVVSDLSESEGEDKQTLTTSANSAISLLGRLKAPKASDLARRQN